MIKFNSIIIASAVMIVGSWFFMGSFAYTLVTLLLLLGVGLARYNPGHLERLAFKQLLSDVTQQIKLVSDLLVEIGYSDFDHNKIAKDIFSIEDKVKKIKRKSLLAGADLNSLGQQLNDLSEQLLKITDNLEKDLPDEESLGNNSSIKESYE